MTTILNGSTVIYNRDGTTISTLSAQGNDGSGSSTATIVRNSCETIVVLTTNATDYACNLPSGAEVGDIVEVYPSDVTNGLAFTPSGEIFLDGSTSVAFNRARFRKVSSTKWARL